MKTRIKKLIIDACKLDVAPEEIKDDAILFGENSDLSLDSIDAIEVILAIEKEFNIRLEIDKEDALKMFNSVHSIVQYLGEKFASRL